MKNKDSFNQCIISKKEIMNRIENYKSFDFLYSDCKIKNHILNSVGPELLIQYERLKSTLNDCDRFVTTMKVKVYPKLPCYEIYYEYEVILSNREKRGIFFDSLSLYAITIKDVFYDYLNERRYIEELLKLNGYINISTVDIQERIPLVPMDESRSGEEFLGCQYYLGHILCYGRELAISNGKIVKDIDQSLTNISEEIIHLVDHSKFIDGKYVVDECISRCIHSQGIQELDALCEEYGGRRLPDKEQSHVWHIGTYCTNEGDIQVVSSTYIYVSFYIKTFYIQVQQTITVKENEFNIITIKRNVFDDDAAVLFDFTTKLYYEAIDIFDRLGYDRQQEINYKVYIDVVGEETKKEIEIGELLFGLQRNEYSYIDKIIKFKG